MKTYNYIETCTQMFTADLFKIAKKVLTIQMFKQ